MNFTKAAALFIFSALVIRADPEVAGEMATPDGPRFVLADQGNSSVSGWLQIGDSFAGYRIESYDRQAEIVTLRSQTKVLQLSLRSSRVVDLSADAVKRQEFIREKMVQYAFHRFAEAKVVIRTLAVVKNKRWYYKCLEVWKSEGNGPNVGDIIPGYVLEPNAANQAPDLDISFGPDAREEITFLGGFPVGPKTSSGGFPIKNGKLNLLPDLSVDEVRNMLMAPKN